jgi:hypothetical protein
MVSLKNFTASSMSAEVLRETLRVKRSLMRCRNHFQIYKHQIKVCQVLHAPFHGYTLFILSPFILLGPHVMWVPCHHGMAHPQFADGEDGLQLWRVDANKLNKQPQTRLTRSVAPAWRLGVGLTTFRHKK